MRNVDIITIAKRDVVSTTYSLQVFKYLGTILNEKNNVTIEVVVRIFKLAINVVMDLQSYSIHKIYKKKQQLNTSLIQTVIFYGTETWPERKIKRKKVIVFKRKVGGEITCQSRILQLQSGDEE